MEKKSLHVYYILQHNLQFIKIKIDDGIASGFSLLCVRSLTVLWAIFTEKKVWARRHAASSFYQGRLVGTLALKVAARNWHFTISCRHRLLSFGRIESFYVCVCACVSFMLVVKFCSGVLYARKYVCIVLCLMRIERAVVTFLSLTKTCFFFALGNRRLCLELLILCAVYITKSITYTTWAQSVNSENGYTM